MPATPLRVTLLGAAEATRDVQWNVGPGMLALLYASMAVALGVFAYGVWRRARIWRLGRPALTWDRPVARIRRTAIDVLAHARLLRERLPGAMHALVFYGFAVLFAATVVVLLHHDLGVSVMRGDFYLYFQSLAVDLFGLLALAGVTVAAWRRFVVRLRRLEPRRAADAALLGVLALILVTGFLLEGVRIAATDDPWRHWSPAGYVLSLPFGSGDDGLRDAHAALWVSHMVLWHALLAAIPFTKLFHLVTSPLSVFFADLGEARGVVPPTDFEADPVRLGVGTPLDLSARQFLSLDACTECGRCQDACPAFAAGKPLSPKRVILDLRDHVRASAGELLEAKAAATRGDGGRCEEILAGMPPLGGGVIRPETLWACTTCRACEEACPVAIEHVPLILQLRQNLAMAQAAVPERVADAVTSLEVRGHPFRGAAAARTDWYAGLPVVELSPTASSKPVELLYWVGCAAAIDDRARRVARALVSVMQHVGVRFAVLGPEESCCGDPARRTGNELHFELLARANVETLARHGVKRIVTHCPHCFQVLKHEYRGYGGCYEVIHHSQLIGELIEQGRLPLGTGARGRIAFHDPCYLGRYNRLFEAPRRVLDALGAERIELPRSRERSFCCGAGGGHAFFEDQAGGKINRSRIAEAVKAGAATLATGCPFCLAMLEDGARGVRSGDVELEVRDIAELLAGQLAPMTGHEDPESGT